MRASLAVVAGISLACGGGAMTGSGGGTTPPALEELRQVAVWEVVQLPGISVLPVRPTLIFEEDGRVGGTAGCNQYGGPFERSEDGVAIGPVVATKMFCEGRMETETAFLAALERTRSMTLDAGTLTLLAEDGSVLARAVAAS